MSERISLTELQLIIRDSLYMALPDMYWVIAEISEINENYAGHCYLELIEKQHDEKNIKARIKAIIWCKRFRFLRSYFENITGEPLREGLKILVKTKIEYHEVYGLSLIICDIDPSFTLGDMAMKRQAIIARLEQEGIFTMNRELTLPILVQRIAIISSSSAAGYTDFMNHLSENRSGYVFYTRLFESPMQGNETEQGIISALDRIAGHAELFDIVVIIRGGGSQTDLSWFDNYNIAYHVTQFPLPVFTGIGHEKDMSVTDMVACVALKTPTAVADFIINHMSEAENRLMESLNKIRDLSRIIIERNRNRLDSAGVRLIPLSRIMISGIRNRLSEQTIMLMNSGKEFTKAAGLVMNNQLTRLISESRSFTLNRHHFLETSLSELKSNSINLLRSKSSGMSALNKTLEILKPENVLRRGYTLTYHDGQIIKLRKNLKFDDIINTRFSDGIITSRITDPLNDQTGADE